jgi:hypothetical protein
MQRVPHFWPVLPEVGIWSPPVPAPSNTPDLPPPESPLRISPPHRCHSERLRVEYYWQKGCHSEPAQAGEEPAVPRSQEQDSNSPPAVRAATTPTRALVLAASQLAEEQTTLPFARPYAHRLSLCFPNPPPHSPPLKSSFTFLVSHRYKNLLISRNLVILSEDFAPAYRSKAAVEGSRVSRDLHRPRRESSGSGRPLHLYLSIYYIDRYRYNVRRSAITPSYPSPLSPESPRRQPRLFPCVPLCPLWLALLAESRLLKAESRNLPAAQ